MPAENLNILLIITDQQRYDSLGCYGAGWVQTPNLDKMSREGVIFDNCYVTNQVCTPSRASMLTGKHLPGHGVYKVHDILPPEEVLITRRLQDRGYRTALVGKLHRRFLGYYRLGSGRFRMAGHGIIAPSPIFQITPPLP